MTRGLDRTPSALKKSIVRTIEQVKLNDYVATREEFQLLEIEKDVFTWVKEGKLNIVIDRVFELEQVRAAPEYLENGGAKGKVLLKL